jgi:hypothetical protein
VIIVPIPWYLLLYFKSNKGKGYPDLATRFLVRKLSNHLDIVAQQHGELEPESPFTCIGDDECNLEFWEDDITSQSNDSEDFWKDNEPVLPKRKPKIQILVDSDPDGIEIMLCYKFGSQVSLN